MVTKVHLVVNWGKRLLATGSGLLVLAFIVFILAPQVLLGSPIVKEHCLNENETQASAELVVDSGWTYILWPPLYFAPVDPPGTCVRNSPFRELLDAAGIWKLGPPEDQVREHIQGQLGTDGSRGADGRGGKSIDAFSEEFTATCRPVVEELTVLSEEIQTPADTPSELDSRVQATRKWARIAGGLTDDLARLDPPESMADEWTGFVDEFGKLAAAQGAIGDAAASGDLNALERLGPELDEVVSEYELALQDLANTGVTPDCTF